MTERTIVKRLVSPEWVAAVKARHQPAGIGTEYFKLASIRYPASAPEQAGLIALLCHEGRVEPNDLGIAIWHSDQAQSDILNAALRQHRRRGKGPMNLTTDRVWFVVQHVYDMADELMGVDPVALESEIDGFHHHFYRSMGERDIYMRQRYNKLIGPSGKVF